VRIAFLTSTPLNIQKGSGTFVGIRTLAEALRKLSVQVQMITPSVHLPVYTAERLLFNEMLRFRRIDADVTVGFDMDGYSIAGRRAVPHVASVKGVIADELRFETAATKATMAVQAKCEALHVRRANVVITTGEYGMRRIEQFYGIRKVHTIPELIDLVSWREMLSRNPAPRDPKKFTVLCVCRLYLRKRVDLLLKAAAKLRAAIPGLELRIVGDGPEGRKLKRLGGELRLDGTVVWLGDVSYSQLASEYNRCDIFSLPSVQEGFGIVFLEAMAAGKPIVAARAAAIPEVLPQGLLVEPDNEQALTTAIESLYRDPASRESLAKSGSERVVQFDAPRVARMFLSELAQLQSVAE
jgi:glycosyltransferase involved in cell wall biosynthesis